MENFVGKLGKMWKRHSWVGGKWGVLPIGFFIICLSVLFVASGHSQKKTRQSKKIVRKLRPAASGY